MGILNYLLLSVTYLDTVDTIHCMSHAHICMHACLHVCARARVYAIYCTTSYTVRACVCVCVWVSLV